MPSICYVPKVFTAAHEAVIEQARQIIAEYQAQGYDLTVRQLYYRFVAADLIPNTKQSYKRLTGIISEARRAGRLDWNQIVDRTRPLHGTRHHDDAEEALLEASRDFALDLWEGQEARVEVWVEKDALIGVIARACEETDVWYHSCRGYPSDSMVWRAARRLRHYDRPVVIHLGDHDPSGIDATRDVEERLEMFAERPIEVERIALTMDQVNQYRPPPNPAKITDPRAGEYLFAHGDESWELDALEPQVIHDLIVSRVTSYLDEGLYDERETEQEKIRETIRQAAVRWSDVARFLNGEGE